jgi:hypothetical protein
VSGLGSEPGFLGNLPGWLRRRHPRLSGTLRIRDAVGHDITIPLRGRAAVLTTGGTGLMGDGAVWAVHVDPDATAISLMISYGRTESPADRESGLCPPGATITLAEAHFTWHCPVSTRNPVQAPAPAATEIPQPRSGESTPATSRTPGNVAPSVSRDPGPIRNARTPLPRSGNTRPTTPNLRQRVQAIVRDITHPPPH